MTSTLHPPDAQVRQRVAVPQRRSPLLIRFAFVFFWALVFTIPWENLIVIPGLGTVAHLLGYVSIGVGVLAIMDSGRLRNPTTTLVLAAAFGLWRCISIVWTVSPDATLLDLQTTVQMLVMLWLLHQLAFSRERMLAVIQAYVLGTFVSAGDTIYQYLHGVNPVGQSRFTAVGIDPNELALMLVLSIPLSLYLAVCSKRSPLVWLYRLQVILTCWAILLTAARGPFLAMAGVVLFLPAVFLKVGERQKAVLVAGSAIAIALAVSLVPTASWKRLATIGTEISSGTLNDRRVIWKAGIEEFKRRPVVGVGAGSFQAAVRNSTGISYVAHNTFLSILVEEGLVGFGLFLALYFNSIRVCLCMPRFERALWLSMLLTMSIGVSSLTWEYRKPFWLVFGLISLQLSVSRSVTNARARAVSSSDLRSHPAFSVRDLEERS